MVSDLEIDQHIPLGDLFQNKTLGGTKWGFQGRTVKMYGNFSALC